MPSEKREEKKYRHGRPRKYSRSTEKKKSERDKEHTKVQVPEVDISSYVDDPAELVSRVFTNLGEKFIAEVTPPIFKSLKLLELKKLCLKELVLLPSETVIRIMNGPTSENMENLAKPGRISSPCKERGESINKKSHKKRRRDCSRKKEPSLEYKIGSSLDSDVASTSGRCTLSSSQKSEMDFSARMSSHRDQEKRESENVCLSEGSTSHISQEQKEDEIANREALPEICADFLRPVPELTELEYRARAIRSMIANIDKINEKSFDRSLFHKN